MACKMCVTRGQTWSGSAPKCAFDGPSETDILVRRIDADIKRLQAMRAYVIGEEAAAPETAAVAPKKRGRGKSKKAGLPTAPAAEDEVTRF